MGEAVKFTSCPACNGGLLDSEDQKYCQHCGNDVTVEHCEKCEHELPDEPCEYCPYCGTEL